MPLDEDSEHARYDPAQVGRYFAAATHAALVLAAFRAPYRGRSTPVNAWWGSFDLAVSLFSGLPADPPSDDFIMRNAMDAQEVAVGWWPGDAALPQGRLLRLRPPGPEGFADATLSPDAARWDAALGEYVLDWDDVCSSRRPARGWRCEFARSAFRHACTVCRWDPALAASAEGSASTGQIAGGVARRPESADSVHAPATGVEHQVTPDLGRPDRVAPHSPCIRQLLDEAQPMPAEAIAVLGDLSRARDRSQDR